MGQSINVVLTESRSGKVDRVEAPRLIKARFPDVAVPVLTENLNDSYIIDAIHAGAAGYIFLKDMVPEALLTSIHRAFEGGTQMSSAMLRAAVENLLQNGQKTLAERTTETAHLTPMEVDVLRLMGNGDSNKTIAENLGITLDTTKNMYEMSSISYRPTAALMPLSLRPSSESSAIQSMVTLLC